MRTWETGGILCPMQADSSLRVSAVANAVLVMFLVLIPVSANGSPVDREEVQPWGCRTCTVPPDRAPAPPAEPGLEAPDQARTINGGAATAVVSPTGRTPLLCGTSCPPLVEIVAAICQPCPDAPPDPAPGPRRN